MAAGLVDRLSMLVSVDGVEQAGAKFKTLGTEAEKAQKQASGGSEQLMATMTKVGAKAAVLGVSLLAVGVQSAGVFTRVGMEVAKLERYTDLSAESASKLRYAAQQSGVDVDVLTKGLGLLAKTAENTPSKFEKLGIAVHDSSGQIKSTNQLLLETADKVAHATTGTEKLAIAQTVFGKSGQALLPLLAKGKDGIDALGKAAQRYGLVLSQDQVDAAKKATIAQRELGAAFEGAQVQIGAKFVPVLTSLVQGLTGVIAGSGSAAANVTFFGGATLVAAGSVAMMIGKAGQLWTRLNELSNAQTTAGVAVVGLAASYAVWQHAIDGAGTAFDKSMAPAKLKASTASMSETQAMIGRTRSSIDDMSASMNAAKSPWDADYRREMADGIQKQMDFQTSLMNNVIVAKAMAQVTGDNENVTLAWLNAQQTAGNTFSTTNAALAAYKGTIDASAMSTDDYAAAIKAVNQDLKDQQDAEHALLDPQFAVLDAVQKATDAQNHYIEVSHYGKITNAETQAALIDVAKATADVDYATQQLTASYQTGAVSADQSRAMLDSWVASGRVTQKQADDIAWSMGITKQQMDLLNATTARPTIDTSQAMAALFALEQAITQAQQRLSDTLLSRGVDRTTGGQVNPSHAPNAMTPNRAQNGMPGAGTNVLVMLDSHQISARTTAVQRYQARGRSRVA